MSNNPNSGHGHVRVRPDGVKARCGGPALCGECAEEHAQYIVGKKKVYLELQQLLTKMRKDWSLSEEELKELE